MNRYLQISTLLVAALLPCLFITAEPVAAQTTYTVINTNDSGSGSLRQAILDANANANVDAMTPDLIHFNISGTGPHTISPLSALPTITDPVVIDGLTQPAASCSSWPPALLIELNGASAGSGVNGLTITAGNSTVRGLVINRFTSDGIEMSSNGANHIECNLIGTNVNGTTDLGNTDDGVFVSGASFNTIGGSSASGRNLISGNNQRGVRILNATASNNQVLGNYIGTDVNGTADLGNGTDGVLLDGAPNNIIGGTTAGLRNIISGNALFGVDIVNAGASGNNVLGNYIGTDATGTAALGNSSGGVDIRNGASTNTIGGLAGGAGNIIVANGGFGIRLVNAGTDHAVQGNLIGLTVGGAAAGNLGGGVGIFNTSNAMIGGVAAGARNVISGNSNNGIEIGGTTTNAIVQGNYIGTDMSGTLDFGNNLSGVYINAASNNFIGGAAPGAGNVISGNNSLGVRISNASGNVVQGNFIGTNASGTAAVANSPNGVEIAAGASNNLIGGTASGAGNLISGHNGRGVFLIDASGNFVQGNLIGTDVTGTLDLGNIGSGIFLHNSINNTIGGTVPGSRNIISGNNEQGVDISSGSTGNMIEGNYIGTDITGTIDLGNDRSGVFFLGSNNTVGGSVSGARNVISGNNHNGVSLAGSAGNVVQGNYIGLNAAGTAALGNTLSGIYVQSLNNTIGGTTADARNVISGNSRNGVEIVSSGNVVQGNYIGTDAAGAAAIGNGAAGSLSLGDGVYVATNNVIIGGTVPGAGNLISGNNADGVEITGTGNHVRGNFIGTQGNGVSPLGNAGVGVKFSQSAQNNTLGGLLNGASNHIAFNGGGVFVETGTGNAVQRNTIASNTGLGIDLSSNGVTANDAGDGDTGVNNLQNFPVLNSINVTLTQITINGSLNSTANTSFTLEFFSNAACDPSNNGEGEMFIGSATVMTDGTGNVNFSPTFNVVVASGSFITATTTDPSGNTSEFAQCVQATGISNQPPNCSGATIADQSAGANCQATISGADVTGVTDPDNDNLTITVSPTTLSLGANSVTVNADDGNGGTCNTTITVNVVDNTAPVLTVSSTPVTLWPPNHKYSTINISQYVTAVSDNCNSSLSASDVVITQVSSDESEDANGGGDGNTTNDIVITSCSIVDLRAERQGSGNGRVYTISLTVDDGNGNTANATIQVHVPKSQNGNPAVDDGAAAGYTVTGNCGSASKLSSNFSNSAPQAVIPEGYALEQNYPNPFNPSTVISFQLPVSSHVALAIFNSSGQLVRTLIAGEKAAGYHTVTWNALDDNGKRVASGVYVAAMKAGAFTAQRKLVLMK